MTGNPTIPERVWGSDASSPLGLMCWRCLQDGNYTAPPRVVIVGGESLCLEHAIGPTALPT